MRRIFLVAFLLAIGTAAAGPASAEFVFRMGDTVYVDGKAYDWEEWKKIRDDPRRLAPAPVKEAATARAADAAPERTLAAEGPRAASCVSSAYYDEFPADEERFQCSASLGALSRDELLRSGWKIDLIEKIPAPAGRASQSARGLPLYQYKLVISR